MRRQLNVQELPVPPHVYFMKIMKNGRWYMRIGSDMSGRFDRIPDHEAAGHDFVALVPGTRHDEGEIQTYFSDELVYTFGTSESHFHFAPVMDYVNKLIEYDYAVTNRHDCYLLGRLDFDLWCPETMLEKPVRTLDCVPLVIGSGQDEWTTPQKHWPYFTAVFKRRPDVDPASSFAAWSAVPEAYRPLSFISKKENGLLLPWGRVESPTCVFLNSPFGKAEAEDDDRREILKLCASGMGFDDIAERWGVPAKAIADRVKHPKRMGEAGADLFMNKLVEEIEAGRVAESIALFNLQSMPTLWFKPLIRKLDWALAIVDHRPVFGGPPAKTGGTRYGAPKNGIVYIYYGPNKERFCRVFDPIAYTFSSMWRGEPT